MHSFCIACPLSAWCLAGKKVYTIKCHCGRTFGRVIGLSVPPGFSGLRAVLTLKDTTQGRWSACAAPMFPIPAECPLLTSNHWGPKTLGDMCSLCRLAEFSLGKRPHRGILFLNLETVEDTDVDLDGDGDVSNASRVTTRWRKCYERGYI